MADILPFKKTKPTPKAKGSSLCRQGHHKWVVVSSRQFDVKQGRLVTVLKCARCAKRKVELL